MWGIVDVRVVAARPPVDADVAITGPRNGCPFVAVRGFEHCQLERLGVAESNRQVDLEGSSRGFERNTGFVDAEVRPPGLVPPEGFELASGALTEFPIGIE